MTNRAGTSFAQNVKTLRMERPDRLVAPVFHVARGCLRHLPQRDKAGERERPVTTRIPRRSARGRPGRRTRRPTPRPQRRARRTATARTPRPPARALRIRSTDAGRARTGGRRSSRRPQACRRSPRRRGQRRRGAACPAGAARTHAAQASTVVRTNAGSESNTSSESVPNGRRSRTRRLRMSSLNARVASRAPCGTMNSACSQNRKSTGPPTPPIASTPNGTTTAPCTSKDGSPSYRRTCARVARATSAAGPSPRGKRNRSRRAASLRRRR